VHIILPGLDSKFRIGQRYSDSSVSLKETRVFNWNQMLPFLKLDEAIVDARLHVITKVRNHLS
jgi:hypothetical protein